jgi:hypothetical protein
MASSSGKPMAARRSAPSGGRLLAAPMTGASLSGEGPMDPGRFARDYSVTVIVAIMPPA